MMNGCHCHKAIPLKQFQIPYVDTDIVLNGDNSFAISEYVDSAFLWLSMEPSITSTNDHGTTRKITVNPQERYRQKTLPIQHSDRVNCLFDDQES